MRRPPLLQTVPCDEVRHVLSTLRMGWAKRRAMAAYRAGRRERAHWLTLASYRRLRARSEGRKAVPA